MNILEHAKNEFKLMHIDLDLDKTNYSYMLAQQVYDILDFLSDKGHTAQSISEVMLLLNKLVYNKALTVITGNDDEWDILEDNTLISKRDSRITKDTKTNKVYFNEAYKFYYPNSIDLFTCKESKVEIHLPILPQELKSKTVHLWFNSIPIKWQLKLHLYTTIREDV